MSNNTEIGRDAYGNIIATGNGNVFDVSSPFATSPSPKSSEPQNLIIKYEQAKELIEFTGYHLRDAELDLLAARLAYACQDSEKTRYHLDKSYQSIERIGYWGFLPEWERVKSSLRRKPTLA